MILRKFSGYSYYSYYSLKPMYVCGEDEALEILQSSVNRSVLTCPRWTSFGDGRGSNSSLRPLVKLAKLTSRDAQKMRIADLKIELTAFSEL